MFLLRKTLPEVVLHLTSNVFHFITRVQNILHLTFAQKGCSFQQNMYFGKHHALLQSTVQVIITKYMIQQPGYHYVELCGHIRLFGDGLQLRRTLATVI